MVLNFRSGRHGENASNRGTLASNHFFEQQSLIVSELLARLIYDVLFFFALLEEIAQSCEADEYFEMIVALKRLSDVHYVFLARLDGRNLTENAALHRDNVGRRLHLNGLR